jgi:cytochrome P450
MGQITQLSVTISILIFTYLLISTLQTKLRRSSQIKANHCLPPPAYAHKDPFLGVDLFLSNIQNLKNITFLTGLIDRWKKYGTTYSGLTLGNPTIFTVDAQNLQTVHAQNFSHYSVEPLRLAATLPLLGRGVFNTDGPFWEHSRALVRPTFTRANVANLPAFEVNFRKFLALLPKDGRTVDLQPLLNRLVCSPWFTLLFPRDLKGH